MNQVYTKQLRQLSYWGRLHAVPARILIAGGHVLLLSIALLLGAVWIPYEGNALLVLQLILFAAAGIIAIVYPKKKGLKGLAGWADRKKLESGLLTCGFLLLLFTGPALREDRLHFSMAPAYAATVHVSPAKEEQTKVGGFLKKLRQRYLEIPVGVKLLIALLLLAAAISIGFGILGLACDLSYGGYVATAALVFFGVGGLLTVRLIRTLVRIYESKEQELDRKARKAERRAQRLKPGEE